MKDDELKQALRAIISNPNATESERILANSVVDLLRRIDRDFEVTDWLRKQVRKLSEKSGVEMDQFPTPHGS